MKDLCMEVFILGCLVPIVLGAGVLVIGRSKAAPWIAAFGVWLGCGIAAVPVISALAGHVPATLQIAWTMPGGSLTRISHK